MKDLCVYDLDGTLIHYDSFGRLLRRMVARQPQLAILALARSARLLGRSQFAERAHRAIASELAKPEIIRSVTEEIDRTVAAGLREAISRWKAEGCHLVLVSASPQEYVRPVGERLGFNDAFGSRWIGQKYLHMHGCEKLRLLNSTFPASDWRRRFAVADRPSDLPFLAAFETSEYLGRERGVRTEKG